MAYIGRAAVAGRYDSRAFVGFVLASKSEPDRKLVIDNERNRVWVVPGEDVGPHAYRTGKKNCL